MDIFERIKTEQNNFTKSYKKVADFICENYEEAAFMSITEVAKRSKVSESVLVRFSVALGYSGFSDLRRDIAAKVKQNLRLPNRMTASSLSEQSTTSSILNATLNKDIENILATLKEPYNESFVQVVQELNNAKFVYIVGNRGLFKVAELTEFLFSPIGIPCISINVENSIHFQKLTSMQKDSVLLAFSLPRYTSYTNAAIKYTRKMHGKSIVISDSIFSPDAKLADLSLEVTVKSHFYINSYTAIISMVNAIVTAIGVQNRQKVVRSLNNLENVLQFFHSDNDELDQKERHISNKKITLL